MEEKKKMKKIQCSAIRTHFWERKWSSENKQEEQK